MAGISLGLASMILVLATTAVWSYRAFKVNLLKDLDVFAILWIIGILMGGFALVHGTADEGAAITAVSVGCFVLFLFAAGKQKGTGGAIEIGDALPSFSAPDENNETFESSSLIGGAVILKVFRGHW